MPHDSNRPERDEPAVTPEAGGRYAFGHEISRSGMGVVFRATDTALGRESLVRILLGKYAPASGTAHRFADEDRITGGLYHPAIPRLLRRGDTVGTPYRDARGSGVSSDDQSIREYAHGLWERAGRPPGDGREFWLRAESTLRFLRVVADLPLPTAAQTAAFAGYVRGAHSW